MKVRIRDNALEILVQWWASHPIQRKMWFHTAEVDQTYIDWRVSVQGKEIEVIDEFRHHTSYTVEHERIRYDILQFLAVKLTLWYRFKRWLKNE